MPINWDNYTTVRAHTLSSPQGEVVPANLIATGLRWITEVPAVGDYPCFTANTPLTWFSQRTEPGSLIVLSNLICPRHVQMDETTLSGFHRSGAILRLDGGAYNTLRRITWMSYSLGRETLPVGITFSTIPEVNAFEDSLTAITRLIEEYSEQRLHLAATPLLEIRAMFINPVDAGVSSLANSFREERATRHTEEVERVRQLRLNQLDEALGRAELSPNQAFVIKQVLAHPTSFSVHRTTATQTLIFADFIVDEPGPGRTPTEPVAELVRPTAWERLSDPLLPEEGE